MDVDSSGSGREMPEESGTLGTSGKTSYEQMYPVLRSAYNNLAEDNQKLMAGRDKAVEERNHALRVLLNTLQRDARFITLPRNVRDYVHTWFERIEGNQAQIDEFLDKLTEALERANATTDGAATVSPPPNREQVYANMELEEGSMDAEATQGHHGQDRKRKCSGEASAGDESEELKSKDKLSMVLHNATSTPGDGASAEDEEPQKKKRKQLPQDPREKSYGRLVASFNNLSDEDLRDIKKGSESREAFGELAAMTEMRLDEDLKVAVKELYEAGFKFTPASNPPTASPSVIAGLPSEVTWPELLSIVNADVKAMKRERHKAAENEVEEVEGAKEKDVDMRMEGADGEDAETGETNKAEEEEKCKPGQLALFVLQTRFWLMYHVALEYHKNLTKLQGKNLKETPKNTLLVLQQFNGNGIKVNRRETNDYAFKEYISPKNTLLHNVLEKTRRQIKVVVRRDLEPNMDTLLPCNGDKRNLRYSTYKVWSGKNIAFVSYSHSNENGENSYLNELSPEQKLTVSITCSALSIGE